MKRNRQAKRNNRARGRGKRDGRDAIMTAEFSTILIMTRTATAEVVVPVDRTLSDRFLAMCQLYEFYRVISMRLEAAVGNWTGGVSQSVLAYLPVEPGVPTITGFGFVNEVPTSVMLDTDYHVPKHLNIRRSHLLATPEKWFSTNGSSTAYSPTQGELILSGQASVTGDQHVRVWWRAQFKNATLGALDLINRVTERDKKIEELQDTIDALKTKKRT